MKVKNPKAQYRGRRRMLSSRRDDSMEKLAQELHVPYDPPESQPEQPPDEISDWINLLAGSATAGTIIMSNLQVFLR